MNASSGEPLYVEFTVPRGDNWKQPIHLFEDEAHSKVENLTGLAITFEIVGFVTLRESEGLHINPITGLVEPSLTPAQTTAAPNERMRFKLKVENNPEDIVHPVHGLFIFTTL